MRRSSDEFVRLLQCIEEEHERELMVLTQEISRLQKCKARDTEASELERSHFSYAAIASEVDDDCCDIDVTGDVELENLRTDRISPQCENSVSDATPPPQPHEPVASFDLPPVDEADAVRPCRSSACPAAGHYISLSSSVSSKRFKLLQAWRDAKGVTIAVPRASQRHSSITRISFGLRLVKRHPCIDKADYMCFRFVISPDNMVGNVWNLLCLAIVCYEVVVVPPECFIGFTPVLGTIIMKWVSRIVWTLDMPVQFMTGIFSEEGLELRPSKIWYHYLRTWFAFDLFLVVSDWSLINSEGCGTTSFRTVLRAARLLRMIQVLRVERLQILVSNLLTVAPDMIVGCADLLKITIVICILTHCLSCFWFTLGTWDQGWVIRSDVANVPFFLKYQLALYGTIVHLHGAGPEEPREAVEYAFAIFMVGLGFITMALFVGKASHTILTLSDSRNAKMQQLVRQYLRTRKVSPKLQLRLNRYVAKCHQKSFRDERDHEREIISSLPECLQIDMHMELRRPLLLQTAYFCLLNKKMLRIICFEAVTSAVAVKPECVFERDIVCTQMFWVESGLLTYSWETNPVGRGACLSEAALWTDWTHCGELIAMNDVTMLILAVSRFVSVVTKIESCVGLTVQYGLQYIALLNRRVADGGRLSDILEFDKAEEDLADDVRARHSMFSAMIVPSEHLVFLSHFKQEAGTEAALISAELEKAIREDDSHPANGFETSCFLDSEALVDINDLTSHVRCSHNLIVLLTPGILARAWCLIEIVTAVRSNVNLVPVEIQRPGMQFKYPGEDFYEALSHGETLTADAISLLRESGVELQELVSSVRHVFQKIALPFSPHKSTKVRQAELCDVLERCLIRQEFCETEDTLVLL